MELREETGDKKLMPEDGFVSLSESHNLTLTFELTVNIDQLN